MMTSATQVFHYYYYRYSALGPVWTETRAQSGEWYGSGTQHPWQVLRGSLPLLSPAFRLPTFATSCLHVRHDARDHSGGRWNCGQECCPVILPKWRLPRHLGIFYMPQIYDTGPTALLPLRRKACWGFFALKNPTASAGFEPANLGTKGQHDTPRAPKPLRMY